MLNIRMSRTPIEEARRGRAMWAARRSRCACGESTQCADKSRMPRVLMQTAWRGPHAAARRRGGRHSSFTKSRERSAPNMLQGPGAHQPGSLAGRRGTPR